MAKSCPCVPSHEGRASTARASRGGRNGGRVCVLAGYTPWFPRLRQGEERQDSRGSGSHRLHNWRLPARSVEISGSCRESAGEERTQMTAVQRICMVVLMALTPADFLPAQETPATPPQSSKEPSGKQEEKIEEDTRKRLEQLACASSGVKFSHHTEKAPQTLPEQPPDKGLIYVIRTK